MLNLEKVLKSLSEKRPIFHAEADFQQSLAWEIREHYPDCTIRLETKVFGSDRKVYLDILCVYKGRKYAIELKYKTLSYTCTIDGEEFALSNQGAQDTGRYDVLKDIQRLEGMVAAGVADEGILIFLTNDRSYYSKPSQEINTVDRKFRIHEGSQVGGRLSWAEGTGQGTMKGREVAIHLNGNYQMNWDTYSQINIDSRSEFQCLMLQVHPANSQEDSKVQLDAEIRPTKRDEYIEPNQQSTTLYNPSWFLSFSNKGDIPLSQIDLRDKLAKHLHQLGYDLQLNRTMGNDKIDIWAEKGTEMMAIEVRYKTALLQTIYEGTHIHLKKQGAQDISRYDYISDLGKVERVVENRPDIKGYALLITNDHLYWQQPKKQYSVDEAFHIHHGHVVKGKCAWKEEASNGTTTGREEPVRLSNSYKMNWQPYLELGEKKNELFQALLVEVK
jgi:hypothetical protein